MKIVLVAAIAENNVIGANGGMPWRLKSDLAHFRALTINKPVVMGRKTFQSIGKPLKDRTNIVVTRDRNFSAPNVITATSFEAALALARAAAAKRGVDEIMIIGGADVFKEAMPIADRLELTYVHARPKGDVLFPPVDASIWRETARREYARGPDDDSNFTVVTLERRH